MDFLNNLNERQQKLFKTVLLVLIALLSMTLIARVAVAAPWARHSVNYLDSKKTTVLELSAAATASSAAITLIPGDVGTPIADKLADLSGYMIIILCAVFLEKYLVTITGYAVFRVLIPLSCLFFIYHIWKPDHHNMKNTAVRIACFSAVLYLVIPASVGVSKLIEATYESSIQETIDSAMENAEAIEENTGSQSIWNKFVDTIEGGINGVTEQLENTLSNFVEATAVLIVTACIIPVLVLILMYWLVKVIFGIDKYKYSGVPVPYNPKP